MAILVVDVWSNHSCRDLKARVDAKALGIADFVELLRDRGVTIVHAPSAAIREYAEHPAVRRVRPAIASVRGAEPEARDALERPALAASFRGREVVRCITGDPRQRITPLRQHEAVRIDDSDFMSVSDREIWALGRAKGITHLLYVGFAAGNCVIGR